ncbi:hypothetical protein C4585_01695 [Candidatus Parcubacteria bacterium]|nr:MAG: hypothetical protein C4585_01695 [Candidatus Parcubacteria bacterium]
MGTRIYKISKYKPSIFQGSLGFKPQRTRFSLAVEHPMERLLFRFLAAVLVGLIFAYVYFVSASVLNVVARKEALSNIASLGSSVALLERDYYAATAAITPSTGENLGLTPISNTRYVHRPGAVGAATPSTNEI